MDTELEYLKAEIRAQLAMARLDFLREALPLATSENQLQMAKSISEAIGEVSYDEAMSAFRRELSLA